MSTSNLNTITLMEPEDLRQKMFLHNCIVDRNYGDLEQMSRNVNG